MLSYQDFFRGQGCPGGGKGWGVLGQKPGILQIFSNEIACFC